SAFVCYEPQKTEILKHLFKTAHSKRVIVFASSKLKVKELSRELRKAKWKIGEMHSDLEQKERDDVMLDFRAGKIDILVATDIVARGIDIDDISMVVNYDVPHEPEDYVHRIGRTARAGTDGKAVTFVSKEDQWKFGIIEKFLEYEVRKDLVPEALGEVPEYNPNRRFRKPGKKNFSRKPNRGNQNRNRARKANDANAENGKSDRPRRFNRNKKRFGGSPDHDNKNKQSNINQ
ncbi:MAG: C-terminal helicase domain-containing protein, partial [Paramuribaculum sp.]|nr:C-terminal helicase domain-containing protein [Paramuribaculum sp.]